MMSFAQKLIRPIVNGVLPQQCVICHRKADTRCCNGCWHDLPWLETRCPRCSLPLPANQINELCGDCLATPPIFDVCLSACRYDHPIDHLINRFKFHGDFTAGKLLADILATHLKNTEYICNTAPNKKPDAIIAVPLHWRRHWQRGFNQANFLADQLGQDLNIDVIGGVIRQHHTPKQQDLKRSERLRNLRNAFAIKQRFDGLHLALVDDVVTTASTANTVATLLKKAGASRVAIWSVARTPAAAK